MISNYLGQTGLENALGSAGKKAEELGKKYIGQEYQPNPARYDFHKKLSLLGAAVPLFNGLFVPGPQTFINVISWAICGYNAIRTYKDQKAKI